MRFCGWHDRLCCEKAQEQYTPSASLLGMDVSADNAPMARSHTMATHCIIMLYDVVAFRRGGNDKSLFCTELLWIESDLFFVNANNYV